MSTELELIEIIREFFSKKVITVHFVDHVDMVKRLYGSVPHGTIDGYMLNPIILNFCRDECLSITATLAAMAQVKLSASYPVLLYNRLRDIMQKIFDRRRTQLRNIWDNVDISLLFCLDLVAAIVQQSVLYFEGSIARNKIYSLEHRGFIHHNVTHGCFDLYDRTPFHAKTQQDYYMLRQFMVNQHAIWQNTSMANATHVTINGVSGLFIPYPGQTSDDGVGVGSTAGDDPSPEQTKSECAKDETSEQAKKPFQLNASATPFVVPSTKSPTRVTMSHGQKVEIDPTKVHLPVKNQI